MKLGSKFLSSLRVTTQLLKMLQCICDCCRWCHPLPKGWCGGSLKDVEEAFVLVLNGVPVSVQLLPQQSIHAKQ